MPNFAPGDRVKHKQLGNGTVFCTKQKGKTIIIVVTFDDFSYLLDDNEFLFFPKELRLITPEHIAATSGDSRRE